jgi:hypothetical protein
MLPPNIAPDPRPWDGPGKPDTIINAYTLDEILSLTAADFAALAGLE